ncbi:NAD(P)/FAD-dependent oxidoreductase [Hoeflea prorocentri]|uniref:FAD-dependent oxidoreductase n=1 Tax=Hoeflea prorocentri TaxID=1922333 RepID=A0A9X3UK44_9HYPH|nr:FAD-dependent oxidoreductase [Hoeflea prorocentri]MCY6382046.1 FAD-dependent oxidoreductase [Hoeflea prorocentri]MDA5399846.1 FAD-dependent oxidoreductase [Hoeflea prorocentri]
MTLKNTQPYTTNRDRLSCDLLVAGAGVVGLWTARLAAARGLNVIVLDARAAGSGASGGLLGALMPHMPERWNPKKQFQFEALASLENEVRKLEAETGLGCGYRRCGRIIPLIKPHHRDLAVERIEAAENVWDSAQTGYAWAVSDSPEEAGWPDAASGPNGFVHETLSARVSPRNYMAALKASLDSKARIVESDGLLSFEDRSARVTTASGTPIDAGHIVLAAGHETFELLGRLTGRPPADYGKPVKGQTALLDADIDADLPLVFSDGTYVVPHAAGTVAVGSTSETDFEDGHGTDEKLDDVIAKASRLCPALEGARVLERWAGLRPKAVRRDPMIGVVPGCKRTTVATGGFKITFGIAHKMAACALDFALDDQCPSLPESFTIDAHLR